VDVRDAMRLLFLACVLVWAGGCNGNASSTNSHLPPPSITLKGLSADYGPGSPLTGLSYAIAGQGNFHLLANGAGFTPSTVLEWDGQALPTTFGDSTDVDASVSNSLIAAPLTAVISAIETSTGVSSNLVPFGVASPAALTAGVIQLITIAPDGSPANGDSLVAPSVSATGRFVAFQSDATNLAPGPASGFQEIYERDTCIGAPSGCTPSTTRITVTYDGSPVNAHSRDSAISADGRYVAFDSSASNILSNAPLCGQLLDCVYLRDTCNGAPSGCTPSTTLISTAPDGSPVGGDLPTMTPDGRFVAFDSTGTGPGTANTYLRDTCNGGPSGCSPTTILVSAGPSGNAGNENSLPQAVDTDGRYIAFDSWATNLVLNSPSDGDDHLYLRDTCIGAPSGCTPSTIQLDPNGAPGLGTGALDSSVIPGISADGRLITFSTNQVNLVSQNVQGYSNVYVRDTCITVSSGCAPNTQLASLANDGSIGNDPSQVDGQLPMSADGRFIAFASLASNLVPGDTFVAGGWKDIFVRDTCFGAPSGCEPSTVRVSITNSPSTGTEATAISDYPAISADGHYVVFLSSATNLVSPPSNGHAMVYLAKTGF